MGNKEERKNESEREREGGGDNEQDNNDQSQRKTNTTQIFLWQGKLEMENMYKKWVPRIRFFFRLVYTGK